VEKNPRRTAKSRNGCQVCKIKRLKCDETRPACDNCTKRGYDCPGYRKALKWSTKYEVLQPDEPDSQKTFHPSVEYHFSSIDPVTFGQASTLSTEEIAESSNGYREVSEETAQPASVSDPIALGPNNGQAILMGDTSRPWSRMFLFNQSTRSVRTQKPMMRSKQYGNTVITARRKWLNGSHCSELTIAWPLPPYRGLFKMIARA
ncbi:hypothetical protein KCU67_g14814, partial [Aureobasidium melanogenum]